MHNCNTYCRKNKEGTTVVLWEKGWRKIEKAGAGNGRTIRIPSVNHAGGFGKIKV